MNWFSSSWAGQRTLIAMARKRKENLVQRDETDYWLGAVIGIFYDGRVECDNISCLFICYVVNTCFCALALPLNYT